ncbi:hypothetical protein [Methylobacterium organophilum]|uniref:Uncharacterized protein n=1 Tax=Methylobacterium organophilum TaxID=410 RepID=A0ABQ4T952_METOR|nr:hypothetical protein [Methylobacterium organophilum]GJE26811.1 hypothetical protein LKMONMHP_1663 [Methylobacterium organophilum]
MSRPRDARGFFLDPARLPAVALVFGVGALAAVFLGLGIQRAAIAYLGAWACLLALPVGALPVVVMIERLDLWRPQPETALLETLRGLLTAMPVVALLALPVLIASPLLYPWARGAMPETVPGWYAPPFVLLRVLLVFSVWTVLAFVFAKRADAPFGRGGGLDDARAAIGLGLHLAAGTLVAGDLILSVSARSHGLLSGLLLMAAWSSVALAAAIVVAPPDVGPSRRRHNRLTPLVVLLGVWALLHAVQYLLAGDRPGDTAWYLARIGSAGLAWSVFSGLLVLMGAVLTLAPGENRTRLFAAFVLLAHALEMFWFVTPSLRGSFRLTLGDLLVLAGLSSLALGLTLVGRRLLPARAPDPREAPRPRRRGP